MSNKSVNEAFVVEVCDRIIEEGQTNLMNLDGQTNEVLLNLLDYLDKDKASIDLNQKIMAYLLNQEIVLYEDECDENGLITGSIQVNSKIYESVHIESSEMDTITIKLIYSQKMMNLLI